MDTWNQQGVVTYQKQVRRITLLLDPMRIEGDIGEESDIDIIKSSEV
jgi:hypothetical protein